MTHIINLKSIFIFFSLFFLISCGGSSGSSDDEPTPTPTPTTPASIITKGSITGFGSIYVNGIKYHTSASKIFDDDIEISEDDLRLGMVVTIEGSIENGEGKADIIYYDSELKGKIEEINRDTGEAIIQGQKVLFNELTYFDDTSIDSLDVGEFVEVNGFYNSQNILVATRIELEDSDDNIEIKGVISDLDMNAKTFTLGSLLIDYSVAEFDDGAESDLQNGVYVKVKGPMGNLDNNQLTISKLKFMNKDIDESVEIEIEGYITDFLSAQRFNVNGIMITTNANTEFENGQASDLQNDVQIEVEGKFNSENVLVADEIEFEEENEFETEGLIMNIDYQGNTFELKGLIFHVTSTTIFYDDSDDSDRYINFSSLNVNDYVEVDGFQNQQSQFIATKVEKEDSSTEEDISFEGTVESINLDAYSFVMLGLEIFTTENTEFEVEDNDLTQEQFFLQLEVGTLLEVEATFENDRFIATEVENEDD